MPNERRLRWTDWVGLVGLAFLLAWTPGYVAQDATEKRLTGGDTFALPMPRDGDRAVLDLVVTFPNGTVERYGPLVEVRFERLSDEARTQKPDAIYRQVIEHQNAAFDLGFAKYRSNQTTAETWFNDEGAVEWRHVTGDWRLSLNGRDRTVAPMAGAYPPPVLAEQPAGCAQLDAVNRYAGSSFHYEPDATALVVESIRRDVSREGYGGRECRYQGPPPSPRLVNLAFDGPAGRLFGVDNADWTELLTAIFPDQEVNKNCTPDHSHPLLSSQTVFHYPSPKASEDLGMTERLRWHRPPPMVCFPYSSANERWQWISPDFPVPVGHHLRAHDENGTMVFQLDLIPTEIERGAGPPLPVLGGSEARYFDPRPSPPGDLPDTTLGAMRYDRTPLVHGLTLADVDSMVQARADGELANFLQRAHLASWSYRTQHPAFAAPEERSTVWHLAYAHDDGTRRSVGLTVAHDLQWNGPESPLPDVMPPTGPLSPATEAVRTWTAQLTDYCAMDYDKQQYRQLCGPLDPTAVSSHRPVLFPSEFRDRIESVVALPNGSFYAPPPGIDSHMKFDPAGTLINHWTPDSGYHNVTGRISWSAASWEADNDGTSFLAHGSTHLERWDITDLGTRYYGDGNADRDTQPPTTLTPSDAGNPLVHRIPTGTTLAWSGLVLMLFATFARLTASLASGTLPAFAAGLYAKIRNEDVLLHERRDAIVAALRADPGLTAKELAQVLGAGWGATVHHLETLQRTGLVTRVVVGRNRHHFLAKETTPAERRLVALRKDPAYAAFLDAVTDEPGRSLDEIAAALPRGLSGVSRTGTRLARDGVVEKRKEGRMVRFYPVTP